MEHENQRSIALTVFFAIGMLGACSGKPEHEPEKLANQVQPLTASTLGEQAIASNNDYLGMSPYVEANRDDGEKQAQLCKACHSLEQGGVNMVGPNLYAFFGRPVGTVEGFAYSNAVLEAEFVWTPRALDAWLAQPSRFLPGNKMPFAGVADSNDRADLIAYLLQATNSK